MSKPIKHEYLHLITARRIKKETEFVYLHYLKGDIAMNI
jgi:hypothetical protein